MRSKSKSALKISVRVTEKQILCNKIILELNLKKKTNIELYIVFQCIIYNKPLDFWIKQMWKLPHYVPLNQLNFIISQCWANELERRANKWKVDTISVHRIYRDSKCRPAKWAEPFRVISQVCHTWMFLLLVKNCVWSSVFCSCWR